MKPNPSSSKEVLAIKEAVDLIQQGKSALAEIKFRKILLNNPKSLDALHLLGITYFQNMKHESALKCFEKAIQLNPKVAILYTNKALSLTQLGRFEEAVKNYDIAIRLNPNYSLALYNRGVALNSLRQFDAALHSYDRAIELKPDFAEAYSNKGNILKELKQLDAAVSSYDKAISIKPDYAEAYCNRGTALKDLKQFDAALASFDMAFTCRPDYAEAFYNKGIVLHELSRYEAAATCFDKATTLKPDMDYLLGMSLISRAFLCDWRSFTPDLLQCEAKAQAQKTVALPFVTILLFDKPDLELSSAKSLAESKYPINPALGPIKRRPSRNKLRIGYFSSDLYQHAVSIWLAEQVENHDKSKFELYAFCFKPVNDPMRERLQASFDHWIDVDKMSDLEVAQLSRDLEIDIAMDMNGYTSACRPSIFAARAAPIQVSHIGFPGTMGAEYIDYYITDKFTVPEGMRHYFSEKIAYLPCVFTYDQQRQISEDTLTRAQFGLPENGFVFTCQNGCQKFTPEVFSIWMEILKATPSSVLWLLRPNETALANLRAQAKAHGIESSRLIFTQRETVPKDQENGRIGRYLASYKLADLFLDTWPYNAGTTAIDALWAGLPVITKNGVSVSARMATSALNCIEMPELIVETASEYKEMAIALATNPTRLKLIKDKLQENRLRTRLFDPVGNTKYIETAYNKMYELHLAGSPPQHLFVNSTDV